MMQGIAAAWQRARRRHGWLDHLARAVMRYDEADGGRLAAVRNQNDDTAGPAVVPDANSTGSDASEHLPPDRN